MIEVELTKLLTNVRTKARQLNAASDEVNATIEHVEAQIAATSIGLECWVPLEREGPGGDPYADEIDLGWAKLGDRWRLTVRSSAAQGAPDDEDALVPLASDSRHRRILALAKLSELLLELGVAADRQIQLIEQARQLGQ